MNILIIGGGSLGLLFAGKLSLSSAHHIHLLTHTPEQADSIVEEGVVVIDGNHRYRTKLHCSSFPIPINGKIAKQDFNEKWDWIFLMVKQPQLQHSLIQYVTRLSEKQQTKLLCFQNGLGHAEKLAEHISSQQIFLAVTTEGAKKLAYHQVRHTGHGTTSLGNAFNSTADFTDAQKKLQQCLQGAGFTASLSKNMDRVVWNKLLINSVINPLTAILRISNGELIASPYYVRLMRALYEEAFQVAVKAGVNPASECWEQLLSVCRHTAENSSSMLQDVLTGRETEIDSINGSILRIAERHQVKTPTHEAVYSMIKGMEKF